MSTWRRGKRPPVNIVSGARSDIGCVRKHNEDSLVVSAPLFAVADGMGGHAAGEVASEIAIKTLIRHAPDRANREALRTAVQTANRDIINAANQGIGRLGMGTTLTAIVVDGDRALIAQVGDSRAYLLRNRILRQITEDHSLVAELMAKGKITPEEAAVHPNRSMITRALGNEERVAVDLFDIELVRGDRLLICSDGLSGMVSSEHISKILLMYPEPQQATDALVMEARANGGLDNITVVTVDILNTPPAKTTLATDDGTGKRRSASRVSAVGSIAADVKAASLEAGIGVNASQSRSLRLAIIAFALLVVLLIAGAIGSVYLYASNAAFLRLEGGYVAIYRGLPGEVFPGVRLEWRESITELHESEIIATTVERLRAGIQVDSLEAAVATVDDIKSQRDVRQTTSATNQAAGDIKAGAANQVAGSMVTSATTTNAVATVIGAQVMSDVQQTTNITNQAAGGSS